MDLLMKNILYKMICICLCVLHDPIIVHGRELTMMLCVCAGE